jgi:hypothetical protein
MVAGVDVAQNFLAVYWIEGIAGGGPGSVWLMNDGRD